MGNRLGYDRPVRDLLKRASEEIARSLADAPEGFAETPYLDAMVLLGDAADLPRERLFAMMGESLEATVVDRFDQLVHLRCSGMPVSYVRGKKEFFGREFEVNEHVLVPRPETEVLVEHAISILDRFEQSDQLHLHDCCTGSGAIAVTIAALRPTLVVSASDISCEALAVANNNATRLLGAPDQVEFFASDLLQGLEQRLSVGESPRPKVITANPPYLTNAEYATLRRADWPEPELALNAGVDGLDIIRRLIRDAARLLDRNGYLITEIGAGQRAEVVALFREAGYVDIEVVRDLAGRDRACAGKTDG